MHFYQIFENVHYAESGSPGGVYYFCQKYEDQREHNIERQDASIKHGLMDFTSGKWSGDPPVLNNEENRNQKACWKEEVQTIFSKESGWWV